MAIYSTCIATSIFYLNPREVVARYRTHKLFVLSVRRVT